ncbi:GtrA family protein [Enterovibrio nigricans]|uniref:Putative flippase GtrA (Transmembrane translocase of bactoprenol-linked glucose) n=1 Tax=Enterovibrio nigricans DSM 22720 TaxID=1121868 RepID=A0A1T4UHE2_9GAMM|nr:GtrA family protein [Enterovibrio nigricans]PKF51304.1 GtrA family protein [Enterovibrio nigricans]SKA52010.1 Putative flippase GtrA (transmembrane translocase of bactoprenol-linked glucose) [Enterovibrio nigricans DSM 22720]
MSSWSDKLLNVRIVRFALTGGLATLMHVVAAFAMIHFFMTPVFVANVIGFACAFFLSYFLQSTFVFKQHLSLNNAFRFFTVQFSALVISQLISEIFQGSSPYLRVLIVVFLIPLVTYIIHKIWTFSEPAKP